MYSHARRALRTALVAGTGIDTTGLPVVALALSGPGVTLPRLSHRLLRV